MSSNNPSLALPRYFWMSCRDDGRAVGALVRDSGDQVWVDASDAELAALRREAEFTCAELAGIERDSLVRSAAETLRALRKSRRLGGAR